MDRTFPSHSSKRIAALATALAFANFATPAMATSEPSTKLVRCGEASCLQISGKRADADAVVSINGHEVPVEGERNWRVHLPVETIRQWSAPYARTIEVALQDPDTQLESSASVDLPLGLLGGLTDLSSLVVSVR